MGHPRAVIHRPQAVEKAHNFVSLKEWDRGKNRATEGVLYKSIEPLVRI
jgi:hypothetical protein